MLINTIENTVHGNRTILFRNPKLAAVIKLADTEYAILETDLGYLPFSTTTDIEDFIKEGSWFHYAIDENIDIGDMGTVIKEIKQLNDGYQRMHADTVAMSTLFMAIKEGSVDDTFINGIKLKELGKVAIAKLGAIASIKMDDDCTCIRFINGDKSLDFNEALDNYQGYKSQQDQIITPINRAVDIINKYAREDISHLTEVIAVSLLELQREVTIALLDCVECPLDATDLVDRLFDHIVATLGSEKPANNPMEDTRDNDIFLDRRTPPRKTYGQRGRGRNRN